VQQDFRIRIIRQGWLGGDAEHDVCSHGDIDLWIGGVQVVKSGYQADDDMPYGISESALALLRTLRYRHTQEHPVAERLIFHGCGLNLMVGCTIGVDWTVRHDGDDVRVADVVHYTTTRESEATQYPGIGVRLPWIEYAREVVAFATEARALFEGVEKDTSTEIIPGEYKAFWEEYNALLDGWDSPGERDVTYPNRYLS
jgi:hypothetical protein